jgi:hypothetical protein
MARKNKKTARKASSSLLMLLIIASAILAFLPFRMTLAAGTTGAAQLCKTLGVSVLAPNGCDALQALSGTHLTVDALGILLANNFTAVSGTLVPLLGNGYLGLKASRVTVDITSQNGTAITGLLPPIGASGNPATCTTAGACASARTIEIKLIMLSVTISGYTTPTNAQTNRYGETNLQALNPALMITLDRVILDLFVDPYSNIATYIASADMTVYQGLALLLQTASL